MTEEGVMLDGELVAWGPENGPRINEAVGKLRAIGAPKSGKRSTTFEALLARVDALNAQLEKTPLTLDDRQRRALGDVLLRLSDLALRRGVVLVQR
jgi:hypothetical protein